MTICFCFPAIDGRLNDSMLEMKRLAQQAGHAVVQLSASPHDRARGMIASQALATGADWLIWCDDDQVATFDQAIGLVATAESMGADLMSGMYVCRHLAERGEMAPNFSPRVGGKFTIGEGGGPYPITSCGFGFVAVHRRVFEKIDAPVCEYGKAWFLPLVEDGYHLGEDRSFGVRADRAGCQLYVDTRCLVGHVGKRVYWPQDFLGAVSA